MKTVFITGGNRGIGLETARQLGVKGFHTIIGSRDAAKGEAAVQQLKAKGVARADAVVLDALSEESVAAAAAKVAELTGGVLDVLVNNAGYSAPRGTTEVVDLKDTEETFQVNVYGVIRVVNHFLPLVKAAPAGRIVNVSSFMGSLTLQPAGIEAAAYNMSKAALNMYTINLARALKDTKVKVNACHPGWVRTDMGGAGADLSVEEGAESSVYLATLPDDGPTGGFFHKKETLPW